MTSYIHGTDPTEQQRLACLNVLTNESFFRFLDLADVRSLLDVGCGLGILAGEIADRNPALEVHGVDSSSQQLASARSNGRPNLVLAQGEAQKLPFESSRFDLVCCRFLLEHVASPIRVLQEMLRVLRPGRYVYVQENDVLVNVFDPDCPQFSSLWRKFVELQTRLGGDAQIGRRLFTLLKQVGFVDVRLSIAPEVHWSGSPHFRPWIDNLAANITGAADKLREFGIATDTEIHSGLDELNRLLSRNDASVFFYWNRAVGMKP